MVVLRVKRIYDRNNSICKIIKNKYDFSFKTRKLRLQKWSNGRSKGENYSCTL